MIPKKIEEQDWERVMTGGQYGLLYRFLEQSPKTRDLIQSNCHFTFSHRNKEVSQPVFVFNNILALPSIFKMTPSEISLWNIAIEEDEDKRKMSAVHSSELLAFLCFSRVMRSPLIFKGSDGIEREYSEVHREWPDHAINFRQPSRLDVFLVTSDKEHALAIECKFGEYLADKDRTDDDRKDPLKTYMDKMGLSRDYEQMKALASSKGDYLEIAKQIFAHAFGLKYFYRKPCDEHWAVDPKREQEFSRLKTIDYAEIVFDFGEISAGRLHDFSVLYSQAAILLNRLQLTADSRNGSNRVAISFEPELLTYQKVFQGKNSQFLSREIKDFYGL